MANSKFYEYGVAKLIVADYNGDGTYGEPVEISGLMSVNITFSQKETYYSADNDPKYLTTQAPTTAEGTIKIIGLPIEDYNKFFNTVTDNKGGVIIGDDVPVKHIGISYVTSSANEDSTDQIKFTMFDCTATLPAETSESSTTDDVKVKDVSIAVSASRIYANGHYMTASKISKSAAGADWSTIENQIYVPEVV